MSDTNSHPGPLVVGYDGSPIAHEALRFARDHAHGRQIVVVHVYEPLPPLYGAPNYGEILQERLERGRAALREADAALGDVEHELELLEGPAAAAIESVAANRRADAIVVGSRGFGRLRATLGSVSHELLHVAGRPVIVVPAKAGLHSSDAPEQTPAAALRPPSGP